MLRRLGLSRAEVLIGLLTGGVLIGLIITTIGKVRESAKRTGCTNNLKQISLGVLAYTSIYDRLPPLVAQGEEAPTGQALPSVFAVLTPFLEASPWNYYPTRTPAEYYAHSSVEFEYRDKESLSRTLHGGIANSVRRTFIDPADTTADGLRDVPMVLPDGKTGFFATGSYAANGLIDWNSTRMPDSFPKGWENVILFSERPHVCRSGTGDVYNLWGLGFYSPHMPAFAALTPTNSAGFDSTGQASPVLPISRNRGTIRLGRMDAEPQLPDFSTPIQFVGKGRSCDARLPGSPHSGVMQAALGDASVRAFSADTEPWVFWSACSPVGQ